MTSWFKRGAEGIKESQVFDKQVQLKFEKRGVWRFTQPNNSTTKAILLDNPDFFVYEHSLYKLTGKVDTETWIREFDSCPLCNAGMEPSLVLFATVIDPREYEDREGKKHKNQKKLIAFKGKARQAILRRMAEQGGNLKYAVIQLSRGASQNEASTGEDIQFLGRLKPEAIAKLCPAGTTPEEFLKPLNYQKLLAPSPPEVLARLVGSPPPVGSDGDTIGSSFVKDMESSDNNIGDVSIDSLID